jgi:hypothetical protein
MTDLGHTLAGVTVREFRQALADAADAVEVIEPIALREPVRLWLLAMDEHARRERWSHLLARPVVAEWNAAQAILAARRDQPATRPDREVTDA